MELKSRQLKNLIELNNKKSQMESKNLQFEVMEGLVDILDQQRLFESHKGGSLIHLYIHLDQVHLLVQMQIYFKDLFKVSLSIIHILEADLLIPTEFHFLINLLLKFIHLV